MVHVNTVYVIKPEKDNGQTTMHTKIKFNYLKTIRKASKAGWSVQTKLCEHRDFAHTPWSTHNGLVADEVIDEYFQVYERPVKTAPLVERQNRLSRVLED